MKKVRRRVIYLTYEAQHGQYAISNFNSAGNVCAMKRLKNFELENSRLRKAVSDLTLDKLILTEATKGNF